MKKLFFLLFLFFVFTHKVYAFDFSLPNNKFGIHLAQPHLEDLRKAKEMINANGGNWGYVTLVIQDNDRNREKWQEIFDLLREEHLIPIIRIATHPEGANWKRPAKEDAQSWADFLNNLHWVVKNRYIVLFNEPNHGSEWGGTVDVENYAEVAKEIAERLKVKSPDFFVMIGAVDASAPTAMPYYLGEEYFLQNFFQTVSIPDFERLFDGLASHSYPNPAFSGSPWDAGRGTVRSYDWELNFLKDLGVQKNLPVFITETGWSAARLSREVVASYLQAAYQNAWLMDNRVIAVTPFVLDYQGDPFLNFSWKKFQSGEFYPQYYAIQSLSKTAGNPEQIDTGELNGNLPKELVSSSHYHFRIKLKNNGQAIWDKKDNYEIRLINFDRTSFEYFVSDIKQVKPFEETEVDLYIKTGNIPRKNSAQIVLMKKDKKILEGGVWNFEIVPLPKIEFKTQLFPKLITEGSQFEIQIFDEKQELVFKRGELRVVRGVGHIDDVQNVIPDKKYRVVILNPFYLPRQTFMILKRGSNTVPFKRMYPFDLDVNGYFDWGDMVMLFKNPKLMRLFFP